MAYQTGTATDCSNLIDLFRLFAIAQGWTIDRYITGTFGLDASDQWLQLHSTAGGYHNILVRYNGPNVNDAADFNTEQSPGPSISGFGATGVNLGSTNFYDQPGNSWSTTTDANNVNVIGSTTDKEATFFCTGLIGPFTAYHFFGNSQYLHCVIEITPGVYSHFGIGTSNKIGTWDGGEYGFGVYWQYNLANLNAPHDEPLNATNSWLGGISQSSSRLNSSFYNRLDANGQTNNWGKPKSNSNISSSTSYAVTNAKPTDTVHTAIGTALGLVGPNGLNGIAPLDPVWITFLFRNIGAYICQTLPDIRIIAMDNINPGQTITYGPDNWLVFPVKRKTAGNNNTPGELSSWRYGIAYKQVI